MYQIPDGYVYELPEIFSSASLASTSPCGNPQRQGILHRELLYQHAVVSYNSCLYCLPEEPYHSSGIPEVMLRNARCEVMVPASAGKRSKKINLNTVMRRMSYQGELDEVHPCFLNDFFIREVIAPPFVYYTILPICFNCQKTQNLFYCKLCRKRMVQTPHVYCSKVTAHPEPFYAMRSSVYLYFQLMFVDCSLFFTRFASKNIGLRITVSFTSTRYQSSRSLYRLLKVFVVWKCRTVMVFQLLVVAATATSIVMQASRGMSLVRRC